jgi:hypothetical protein
MTASLGMRCGCGRDIVAECPTLSDIPAAQQQFIGWGYDERGLVRCPDCLAAGVVEKRPAPGGEPDLFGGVAA